MIARAARSRAGSGARPSTAPTAVGTVGGEIVQQLQRGERKGDKAFLSLVSNEL